jgi:Domain of unknown function (DUF3303)
MLFLVIEQFRNGDPKPAGERFARRGRMLPEGLAYLASWMECGGARCYQVMEAADRELVDQWIGRWDDLVDFEVVPVLPSADYWAKVRAGAD